MQWTHSLSRPTDRRDAQPNCDSSDTFSAALLPNSDAFPPAPLPQEREGHERKDAMGRALRAPHGILIFLLPSLPNGRGKGMRGMRGPLF
jgi:hypothetical protein